MKRSPSIGQKLPPDILEQIAKAIDSHCHAANTLARSIHDLTRGSRVCRSWREPMQRQTLRYLSLVSVKAAKKFIESDLWEKYPVYSLLVGSFAPPQLEFDWNWWSEPAPDENLHATTFQAQHTHYLLSRLRDFQEVQVAVRNLVIDVKILQSFQNLRTLSIDEGSSIAFKAASLTDASWSFPHLTSLQIEPTCIRHAPKKWSFLFAIAMPKLTALKLNLDDPPLAIQDMDTAFAAFFRAHPLITSLTLCKHSTSSSWRSVPLIIQSCCALENLELVVSTALDTSFTPFFAILSTIPASKRFKTLTLTQLNKDSWMKVMTPHEWNGIEEFVMGLTQYMMTNKDALPRLMRLNIYAEPDTRFNFNFRWSVDRFGWYIQVYCMRLHLPHLRDLVGICQERSIVLELQGQTISGKK